MWMLYGPGSGSGGRGVGRGTTFTGTDVDLVGSTPAGTDLELDASILGFIEGIEDRAEGGEFDASPLPKRRFPFTFDAEFPAEGVEFFTLGLVPISLGRDGGEIFPKTSSHSSLVIVTLCKCFTASQDGFTS